MFQLAGGKDSEHRFLDNFGPKTALIFTARESIRAQLEKHQALPHSKEKASLLLRLLTKVQLCKSGEYEKLVGVLNLISSSRRSATLDRNLELLQRMPHANILFKEIAAIVSSLHGMLLSGEGAQKISSQEIAEEVLLFIRATYPLGINICNPTWNDKSLPVGFPADTSLMFGVSPSRRAFEWIVIKSDGDSSVVKVVPQGRKWEQVETRARLSEGSTLLVGRIREIHHAFGMPFTEGVRIIPQLLTNDTSWSRLGIMLVRHNGRIFAFDRGSRYPLQIALGNEAQLMYVPRPVLNENGGISFGDTSIVG